MVKSKTDVIQGMQQRLLDKIKELEAIENMLYLAGASGMEDVNAVVLKAREPIQEAIDICKKRYASNTEYLKTTETD